MAQELQNFIAAANAYCDFIDSFRDNRPDNLYSILLERLSMLAGSAHRIPFDMPDSEDAESLGDLTTDERASISRLIHGTIGHDTATLQQQKTEDDECEQTRRLMYFDDLADLYSDIKSGLRCYETGTAVAMSEATWQWRFGYEHHWGTHLLRALRTTHEIRFELNLA